jgi:hypothetical protein
MKNRQHRIIIGTLVGLLLFSSSLALLFYSQQGNANTHQENMVEVFVSSKDIQKGTQIDADMIKKISLPQAMLPKTPLVDTEIVERYAAVDIYENEPFRVQKLSETDPLKTLKIETFKEKLVQNTNEGNNSIADTFTLPLSLFKNIDPTLKKGDYVDIVSVTFKGDKEKKNNFSTKYVAIHIPVSSFIINEKSSSIYTIHGDDDALIKAQSIVLEVSPKEIKNFLKVYYKTQELSSNRVYNTNNYGGQLWLVKSSKNLDAKTLKVKQAMLVDKKTYVARKKNPNKVSISYEK